MFVVLFFPYGLPLKFLNKNSVLYSLMTLYDIGDLEKDNIKSYFIGTTNPIFMNYKKIEFDCIINIDENKIIFSKLLGSSLLRLGKIERDIMKLINKQCDINSKGLNNDNLISGELVFEETENQSNRIKHKQEQQEGYKASPKKNSLYNQKQKNDEENSIKEEEMNR